ncbi:hypothetical protein [Neomegalonema sp.]|uniref:hypothetical protein n=1 Tax=Neomegalonema sp. TaxID=2039713 RepID=UPI002618CF64|nr:hypothetical protein [Neomegalonema sp.]MDD2867512.1 hypothetical protein [Neomegalonema sp.]
MTVVDIPAIPSRDERRRISPGRVLLRQIMAQPDEARNGKREPPEGGQILISRLKPFAALLSEATADLG